MGIKSTNGMSSVKLPHKVGSNPNSGIQVVSGKHIVGKAINAHRANPGFKKGK
jgi:hypothetical protein